MDIQIKWSDIVDLTEIVAANKRRADANAELVAVTFQRDELAEENERLMDNIGQLYSESEILVEQRDEARGVAGELLNMLVDWDSWSAKVDENGGANPPVWTALYDKYVGVIGRLQCHRGR